MIEVLVTIVLISIGVLGMVAMQARTIAYTQDSVQRNTAAVLADDLLEMLRADTAKVLNANGIPRTTSDYYKADGSSFPAKPNSCSPLPSAASQRLGCWAARVQDTLPDAANLMASNFHVAKAGSAIEIKLAWRVKKGECLDVSANAGNDDTICHYIIRAEI